MPNYSQVKRQIDSFAELPEGWHYGSGRAPSEVDIGIMTDLLLQAKLLGFEKFEAFPGAAGEIELAIYDGIDTCFVTIDPDGTFAIAYDKNEHQISFRDHMGFYDVVTALEDFAFKLWDTSELFTPETLPSAANPPTSLSSPQVTARESPASMKTVPLTLVVQSAHTSPSTMARPQAANPSSIGGYLLPIPC